jgi:hypothetical protein
MSKTYLREGDCCRRGGSYRRRHNRPVAGFPGKEPGFLGKEAGFPQKTGFPRRSLQGSAA